MINLSQLKNLDAVTGLIGYASGIDYAEALNEFWECWLTHELTEELKAADRAEKLYLYKNMKEFLDSIV